ncbi:AAA family ATPase [Pseudanabaena yagii]|uniref:AAA family ATPase n=1 Tax=Pseudanabaena yagii GIHE-NHR1 TaxID=2722753 RepID=A0ABX1M068_9CYAN|nr:AAA family ATPase [Pseudanabaena yagii]NMF60419.1 AAA family ATPase [Pseudanabaena yagii GIHE-NHR1]
MKINWLTLKDFRGFRDCEITFPKSSNIVVFIGINGAGKSAILDAISILLNVLVKDICNSKKTSALSYKELTNSDIHLKAEKYKLQMSFSHENDKNYQISITYRLLIDGNYNDFISKTKLALVGNELFNLPILICYSINRTVVGNNTKTYSPKYGYIPKYQREQLLTYENSFNSSIDSFNEFTKWFREEEDLENQNQRNLQDFKYRNEKLEVIRLAINTFLNKFGFARFVNLRVERSPSHHNFTPVKFQYTTSLVIDKDGERFEFSQLSSGEKMMLSLVVDIARRLAIANPSLDNKLEGEGIVLIDEVDLHLHPQWQRKLLPALTHTFPNIQFIVTTHSPQVLSHLPRESVFLLEDNKISDREIYTEGRDSNSILQDAFHVPKYEKEYEKELNEIYHLIDKYDGKNAQELLEKLKEKRGENDLEIMRMQSYIDLL